MNNVSLHTPQLRHRERMRRPASPRPSLRTILPNYAQNVHHIILDWPIKISIVQNIENLRNVY